MLRDAEVAQAVPISLIRANWCSKAGHTSRSISSFAGVREFARRILDISPLYCLWKPRKLELSVGSVCSKFARLTGSYQNEKDKAGGSALSREKPVFVRLRQLFPGLHCDEGHADSHKKAATSGGRHFGSCFRIWTFGKRNAPIDTKRHSRGGPSSPIIRDFT